MMSELINSAVFPGIQGGPLEHVIAAKAVSFGEALLPEYAVYQKQVQKKDLMGAYDNVKELGNSCISCHVNYKNNVVSVMK